MGPGRPQERDEAVEARFTANTVVDALALAEACFPERLVVLPSKWCKRCEWLGGLRGEALRAAERRGGQLLDDPGDDRDAKLGWRCKNGHIWWQRVQVIAAGLWCAKCADTRLTIEEMHRTAQKNLGRCLSTEYVNSATKLLWECSEKHQWWATPNNIRMGKWCRTCRMKAAWEQRRADAKDRR